MPTPRQPSTSPPQYFPDLSREVVAAAVQREIDAKGYAEDVAVTKESWDRNMEIALFTKNIAAYPRTPRRMRTTSTPNWQPAPATLSRSASNMTVHPPEPADLEQISCILRSRSDHWRVGRLRPARQDHAELLGRGRRTARRDQTATARDTCLVAARRTTPWAPGTSPVRSPPPAPARWPGARWASRTTSRWPVCR